MLEKVVEFADATYDGSSLYVRDPEGGNILELVCRDVDPA